MYFTYVVRPGEAPMGRSPNFRPFWDACMNWNLRLGLGVQLAAFLVLESTALVGGGGKELGFVHIATNQNTFDSSWAAAGAVWASIVWVIGACMIQGFRNTGDDDGSIKYSRGYRAGTKLLSQATMCDIASAGMMALGFFKTMSFMEDAWTADAIQPNPMIIFGFSCRLLHAVACGLYGSCFFLMEAYHSNGTAEIWGWLMVILYKAAAISELLACFFNSAALDGVFTICFLLALLSSFLWSQAFEPMVLSSEVKLDQSALRNEYFKSQNSMAYYGPQIDDTNSMIG